MWYIVINNENSGQPATRYLSGFGGSTSVLIFESSDKSGVGGRGFLILDARYHEMEAEIMSKTKRTQNLQILKLQKREAFKSPVQRIIKENSIQSIWIDSTITHHSTYKRLLEYGVTVECDDGFFEMIRSIKSADELALIRKSLEIAEQSFEVVRPLIKVGAKESDIATKLEYEMKMRGAEKVAFDTIVTSGANSATPHAQTTSKRIGAGDSVIIDFGCVYEGYVSDITNTILMPEATPRLREVFGIVEKAHDEAVKAITVGMPAKDLDGVARNIIEKAGYGEYFIHSTGHGVGMSIHESPHIRSNSQDTLVSGHVITIEPGIYIPGVWGVRIETTEIVK